MFPLTQSVSITALSVLANSDLNSTALSLRKDFCWRFVQNGKLNLLNLLICKLYLGLYSNVTSFKKIPHLKAKDYGGLNNNEFKLETINLQKGTYHTYIKSQNKNRVQDFRAYITGQ